VKSPIEEKIRAEESRVNGVGQSRPPRMG